MPHDLPWPLPDRSDLRDQLIAAYSTGRGYHDLQHLAEVLARLEELGEIGNTELVLAAWFHDAVYDTSSGGSAGSGRSAGPGASGGSGGSGGGDNEERSARLAETTLAGAAIDTVPVDVSEVARLVRLTKHHDPEPGDRNGEALCDADLAILASPPDRYREYAAGVRHEYAAVSDTDFRAGRLAVLEELGSRTRLFRTAYAREHWEPIARENLAREIDQLRAAE